MEITLNFTCFNVLKPVPNGPQKGIITGSKTTIVFLLCNKFTLIEVIVLLINISVLFLNSSFNNFFPPVILLYFSYSKPKKTSP